MKREKNGTDPESGSGSKQYFIATAVVHWRWVIAAKKETNIKLWKKVAEKLN